MVICYTCLFCVPHVSFIIDHRILSTCLGVADGPLSRILLKNDCNYPWLILVPRKENIQDIDQLSARSRHVLMDEISQLSLIIKQYFKPDKLNVGALGNIVPQLHIHLIARFTHDNVWPHGVWQSTQTTIPYAEPTLKLLLADLRDLMKDHFAVI